MTQKDLLYLEDAVKHQDNLISLWNFYTEIILDEDLVDFINDVEQGEEKSAIQKMSAYELYDRYTCLGGNSYVHDRWEKLRREGKL